MRRELFDVSELSREEVGRRLAQPRLFLQRLSERMRDEHSQIEILDPDIRRRLILVLVDQGDCRRRIERRSAGDHFIEQETERIDVGLHDRILTVALFR